MKSCPSCHHDNGDEAQFCGGCGASLAAPSPFQVGGVVGNGRYRIDGQLGEGGMGTVWKATDTMLGRTVALKCLAAELTAHPTARRRMEQEARVLARVESPHVVQVRNVFEEAGILTLELEFVAGGDLEAKVRPGGMADGELLPLALQVLDGLAAIHAAGLVHRDIKPANILLDPNGIPKITDLGIAHDPTAREKTKLGASLGTPDYMSPEQIQGVAVDSRSDLYSVGIMCYQLLTGGLPFEGKSEFDIASAHVREAPDLGRLARTARAGTVAWIARALAKAPEDRWQDAAEMAAAAKDVLAGREPATAQAAPTKPPPAAPSRPPAPRPTEQPTRPATAAPAVAVAEEDSSPAIATSGRAGGGGAMWGLVAVVVVVALGVGGFFMLRSADSDAQESPAADPAEANPNSAAASAASSVGSVAGDPVHEAPTAANPSMVPALHVGDRWRYRYQRLPKDRADTWRTYDHFVDRKLTSVEPTDGGIIVTIEEVGGPEDEAVRTFREAYTNAGIGTIKDGAVEIAVPWDDGVADVGDVAISLPDGEVKRFGPSTHRVWMHPSLGKIAESSFVQAKGDTYVVTLVGYAIGDQRGGDIDGEVLRCVWNGRSKWLEMGQDDTLLLAGAGHSYSVAKASRGGMGEDFEVGSSLEISGLGAQTLTLGDGLGSLIAVKTWITPTKGEWLAALWRGPETTSLSIVNMKAKTARAYRVEVQTIVPAGRHELKDHSLLLLQKGNQCIVGIKGKGPGGRKFVMVQVPDDGEPTFVGGDWPRSR